MNIFVLTIIISILIYLVIGSYAGRKVKQLDDYFVAGRRAPTLLILGTLVASVFSTAMFMGEAAFTYETQMGPYILFPSLAVTGYMLGALFFGVYLRRSRAPTVADFLGQRFQSRRIQQFAGYTIIFGLGGYLLVVTQGATLLLTSLTGLSYITCLIIAWFSYTIFTMYSGSRGVIITDTLMFLLFTSATVIFVVWIVDDLGGVSTAITNLTHIDAKQGLASWVGMVGEGTDFSNATELVIWVLVMDFCWILVYMVGPWQASRHLMARNEHVVLRAAILAMIFVIVLQILIYGVGGLINLYKTYITPGATVLIWTAQNVVPEMLGALLLAGIVAAGLSSASTFLSLVGFSVANDIGPKPLSLRVNTTRLIVLITSLFALVGTYFYPPDIFWFMLFIGTVFATSWGPAGIMSIWSKRITKDGAYWGMVTGFFMNLVPALLDHVGLVPMPEYAPSVIGIVSSVIVILLVSSRGSVSRDEQVYRMRLHRTPGWEISKAQVRKSIIAPIMMVIYGLSMPFLTLWYYVIPYQLGTGEILPDGSINWNTPEALIPFAALILHVPLALMAIKIIRGRYHPDSQRNRKAVRRAIDASSNR